MVYKKHMNVSSQNAQTGHSVANQNTMQQSGDQRHSEWSDVVSADNLD